MKIDTSVAEHEYAHSTPTTQPKTLNRPKIAESFRKS